MSSLSPAAARPVADPMRGLLGAALSLLLLVPALLMPALAYAQDEGPERRPRPYPIEPPPRFQSAVEAGTRTMEGRPGPDYWTSTARYDIDLTLSPETRMVRGTETIHYANQSPDTLQQLVVHLRQNIYKEGSARRTALRTPGGVELADVAVDGQPLAERPASAPTGYRISNTVMRIDPPAAVAPGDTVRLDFAWNYKLRKGPGPREGTDGEVYYLGYFYPQMAVYDDVQGWDTDPFLQHAEFYMGHADYDLSITVPADFLVAATGTLQNPGDVLTDATRRRLERARQTRDIVSVVGPDERGAGTATAVSPTGTHTWHYRAERVRDVAIGTSDRYVWDATSARTGASTGGTEDSTAMVHALYRPGTDAWDRAAEFGQFSVEFCAERLIPYPYPHMTVVEGIVGGGMEYPMMTIIGGDRTDQSLFGTTLHEIAHMWFPMIVGSEETDHIWMDEGLVTYLTRMGTLAFWGDEVSPWAPTSGYFNRAGTARETEPMRHGDLFPSVGALVTASYDKASRILYALRGIVGAEAFDEAFRTYAERWAYKHPYPYDLFNTFESVLGRELDWFWRPLLYTTRTLDHAVASVEQADDGVTVTVEDQGRVPMPVPVQVTYADGTTQQKRIPVDPWLAGERTATVSFDAAGEAGPVERVTLDPDGFLPDVDRADNTWTPSD